MTGWWFGTMELYDFVFFHILGIIIPTDVTKSLFFRVLNMIFCWVSPLVWLKQCHTPPHLLMVYTTH